MKRKHSPFKLALFSFALTCQVASFAALSRAQDAPQFDPVGMASAHQVASVPAFWNQEAATSAVVPVQHAEWGMELGRTNGTENRLTEPSQLVQLSQNNQYLPIAGMATTSQTAAPTTQTTQILPASAPVQSAAPTPLAQSVPQNMPQTMQTAQPSQTATSSVVRNHRLQNMTPQQFEQKLTEKLGNRLLVVPTDPAVNQALFRLPARDGSQVELTIDRQNGMVTLVGTTNIVDSCLQIVQLLDTREVPGGQVTQFVPVQNNAAAMQNAANVLNQESQRAGQMLPQQPLPRPEIHTDAAMRFVAPGTVASAPTQEATEAALETVGSVVNPVKVDVNSDLGIVTITGDPDDVRAVTNVLQNLEIISKQQEPLIELVALSHGDCYRVNMLVQNLYSQIYSTKFGHAATHQTEHNPDDWPKREH